jgi:hypothetical protein
MQRAHAPVAGPVSISRPAARVPPRFGRARRRGPKLGAELLLALVIVLAAEINVVAQRRRWPRALPTPFTDRADLTSADVRVYTACAKSERHKGFEVVDVDFEPPAEEAAGKEKEGDEPRK